MKITPRYHSIALAAGQELNIADFDQFVTIFDITGATSCEWAFDDENWETVLPGTAYELPAGERFFRVRLRNPNPGAITVVVTFSPGRVYDNRLMNANAVLAAMAGSLAAIDLDTSNLDVPLSDATALLTTIDADTGNLDVPLSDVTADTTAILAELRGPTAAGDFDTEATLAATTATEILPANANAVGRSLQAKSTNAESIYVGFADTVTNVKWALELEPGRAYTYETYRGPLYAYSVAGGDEIAYGEW